jgi:hypothetical protein
MYLSDDMSEQELLDAAAEQLAVRAGRPAEVPQLADVLADFVGRVSQQRRESGLYVPRRDLYRGDVAL